MPVDGPASCAESVPSEEDGVVGVGWRESDMDTTTLIVLALAALIYWWGLL